jgi:glutamine amidotransferase
MSAVTLLDYGLGNIRAFYNIYLALGVSVEVATSSDRVSAAKRIVLPGVGSFDHAMVQLRRLGFHEALDEAVQSRSVPVLGVCVGMQMLMDRSEEGVEQGLGWIRGSVAKFGEETSFDARPLPHMGWNRVSPCARHAIFGGLESPEFYFLHSYFCRPDDPAESLATTTYGASFSSVIARGNIIGVQFHPEKSHGWGVRLLKNFAEL